MTATSCKSCLIMCGAVDQAPEIVEDCPCVVCLVRPNCSEICDARYGFWDRWKEKYILEYTVSEGWIAIVRREKSEKQQEEINKRII